MTRRFSLSAWLLALTLLALSMMAAPARPQAARPAVTPAAASPTRLAPPAALPRALPTEDGVETQTCFDGSCQRIFRTVRKNPHVIAVPQQSGDELASAEARDRRWVARCRPTIRQDMYGMPRYIYAAAGCEFGRLD